MKRLSNKTSRVIQFSAIALILAIVIALNVVAGVLFDFITIGLQGANVVATDFAQADELCQDIAGEGAVLLKNAEVDGEPALPLKPENGGNKIKVNVFGWGATDGGFISGGSGSSAGNIDPSKKKSFMQALTEKGFEYNTELAKMYSSDFRSARANTNSLSGQENFFTIYEPDQSYFTQQLMNEALSFSDTALIVISRLGGEGQDLPRRQTVGTSGSGTTYDDDRTYLELSKNEEDMVNLVKKSGFKKVVVILNTCNIFECGFIDDGVDAALSIGAVGQSGALAIADILKGDRTPSGKTADTYPYALENDPSYANSGRDQASFTDGGAGGGKSNYVDYAEGIYVGYRYYETADEEGYIDYDKVVQYPFGYGLSYTGFEWNVLSWKPNDGATIAGDGSVEVSLEVVNTGAVKGQDVVEVYFTAPYTAGGIEKSHVELVAFYKTQLIEPGASERVSLRFNVREMASYDCYDANENGFSGYELDAGNYTVSLRTDAHNVAKCKEAEVVYKLSGGVQYETDEASGNKIENHFTGSEATDNGISLDGTTSNANIVYMSRADFATTFPKTRKANRARGYTVASNWLPTQKNTTEEYDFGQSGDVSLTLNDGKDMNEDVIFELGNPENFDKEEIWDNILRQITLSEMSLLVRDAGYQTEAIASIGKLRHHDLDGPSGFNTTNQTLFDSSDTYFTAYPVETVLAQSWNAVLSYSFGLGLGVEGEAGIAGIYAPGVNIHRNAFDGRNFEYFSEDPYLSGMLGSQIVKGAKANGLYCYVKHFAVNESETNREGLCTFLTEQAMREIYCKPFELCVKEGKANAFMSSFNFVGGTWSGASYALLTQLLRQEWGFKGSVVSDWAPNELRGYMSIDRGIRAGNDLWLAGQHGVSASHISNLESKSEAGATTRACLRESTKNALYTYCNTMYEHKNHDSSQDKFVANVTTKGAREQFPYWILALIVIDVAAIGGCGFWVFMIIRKKRRENAQNTGV